MEGQWKSDNWLWKRTFQLLYDEFYAPMEYILPRSILQIVLHMENRPEDDILNQCTLILLINSHLLTWNDCSANHWLQLYQDRLESKKDISVYEQVVHSDIRLKNPWKKKKLTILADFLHQGPIHGVRNINGFSFRNAIREIVDALLKHNLQEDVSVEVWRLYLYPKYVPE
jgi:hypothetical protein